MVWVGRLFKMGRLVGFWKWFDRLSKMLRWKCRPPFINYIVAFWKLVFRLFKMVLWQWINRLFKMVWPSFEDGSTNFWKLYGRLLKMVWVGRFFKTGGRPPFQNRLLDRLLKLIRPPFENASLQYRTPFINYIVAFWKSIGRLFKMVWPSFEDGSTMATFWKLYGRLFKMGRPLFQNGLIGFWKWVDRLLKIISWKCQPPQKV